MSRVHGGSDSALVVSAMAQAVDRPVSTFSIGFGEASLLVEALTKFVKYHSGLISDIKSLEFLDKLKSSQLN